VQIIIKAVQRVQLKLKNPHTVVPVFFFTSDKLLSVLLFKKEAKHWRLVSGEGAEFFFGEVGKYINLFGLILDPI